MSSRLPTITVAGTDAVAPMIKRPIYAPVMEGTSPVTRQPSGNKRAEHVSIGFLPKASEYGGKTMLPKDSPIPYLYKQMRI